MKTRPFVPSQTIRLLTCTIGLALSSIPFFAGAAEVNGTFKATETWTAQLIYKNFGPQRFTGTKEFTGTRTGTIVVQNGQYALVNASGVSWKGASASLTTRSIYFDGSTYRVQGDYPFVPAYSAKAQGLVFAGCFGVSVPLIDGEVPIFYRTRDYSASGSSLSQLRGGGEMTGESLRVIVSSTFGLQTGSSGGDPASGSPLAVTISGSGTVSPNYEGKLLEVGRTYTITAKPAAGHVFAGWTGSVEADTPTLSFEMKKGMALQANFVPSPFMPVKGVYSGLVLEGSGFAVARSGFFSLTVTDMGAYSGRLQLGAARYAISGQFNPSGQASVSTPAGKAPPVTVQLQLDLASGSDRITGSVSGSGWSAGLEGDRAVFDGTAHLAAAAGNYTLVIPGEGSCSGRPGGDGYGTVMVDGAGKLRFAGVLADGSKVSQSATLSKSGEWPLFVSLDRGSGMLLGWVALGSSAAEEMVGEGVWVKAGSAGARCYPDGFAMNVAVTGSRYVAPVSGSNPLGLSEVEARLQCGGLGAPVVLGLTLDGSGKVTNLSSKEASLGFNAKTGVFKGRSTVAGQAKPVSFSGVVLQSQQTARGFFLGTEASGSVWMGRGQ